jgi:hypothetical protein
MTPTENGANGMASVEDIQKAWHELTLRVAQLEAERTGFEHENKALKSLIEKVIEHRQKSHSELVLLLAGVVSKLQINDVGVQVSRLVEHNKHVCDVLTALAHGKAGEELPQPQLLKELDHVKRDLVAALKPLVEELIQLGVPLETEALQALPANPESFYSPRMQRATRCFIKGQLPKERIVREFGEDALFFFNDMTTDPKLNPRPKQDEIVLAFKPDFEILFQQNPTLVASKRDQLKSLFDKVQRSKASTPESRAQKIAFAKLSFILDLLHYYENQSTEAPDVVFAQRMPAIVEQLVITGPEDDLDEKLVREAETLLNFVINPDHRLTVICNLGKGGGSARTLKFVLRLRVEKVPDLDEIMPDFMRHLIPNRKMPDTAKVTAIVRLLHPAMQKPVVRALMSTDRLRKEEADALGKAIGSQLGLSGLDEPVRSVALTPEMERQLAWDRVKLMITDRAETAAIAAAVRARLHAKYDADEIKQSWMTLIEVEPISFIRVFCQIPYLPDGRTDSIARAVMESYVTRLTHEKYASTYNKVVNSLRNMFRANPEAPTLVNFMALVRWVDAEAANKISADIGMLAPAPQ